MFEREERQKRGEKHPSEYLRGKVRNGLMHSLFSTNKQTKSLASSHTKKSPKFFSLKLTVIF